MAPQATATRTALRAEIVALQLFVGLLLVFRLYYDFNGDLLGDEAYYWMWGQHLGWSYFDHPPLHAWLLRLVSIVAGWHMPSVRLLTWATLGGIFLIFRDWAARLNPADPKLWFWRTAAIYLASPLFFGMTTVAYNDHLLVFCSFLAIHCFVVFTDRFETGAPNALRWLYLAAGALGLAVLSKYNGLFVGFGFIAAFLLRPKLRALLATPHPWLAALLAAVMQAPVIWWNLTENLASFRYHLDDRWGGTAGQLNLMHPVNFVLVTTILWSPFLIWPLLRLSFSKPLSDFESRARTVALGTFVISTLFLLAISLVLDAYFYWNIVAFVGVMPLLTRFLQNRILLWAHLLFGLLLAALVVMNFGIIPVGDALHRQDNGSSINYGWSEVADHIRAAEAIKPVDLVAATRYSTTSQLGFALGTTAAVKLSPEHSQYDYWQNEADFAGKSALILTDEPDDSAVIAFLRAHFTTLDQVDSFGISRFGIGLYSWRIWRGDGYIPTP